MLEGSLLFLRLWLIGLIVCPISRVWKIILSVYGRKFFLLRITLPLHSNIEIIFLRFKKKKNHLAKLKHLSVFVVVVWFMWSSQVFETQRSALVWFIVKCKSLSHVQLSATPWIVHGILQARILEWVAFPFSRVPSQPRDQTQVSCITGGFFTSWATRGPKNTGVGSLSLFQGTFPSQESNQGLLHCRQILYQLSYQGIL